MNYLISLITFEARNTARSLRGQRWGRKRDSSFLTCSPFWPGTPVLPSRRTKEWKEKNERCVLFSTNACHWNRGIPRKIVYRLMYAWTTRFSKRTWSPGRPGGPSGPWIPVGPGGPTTMAIVYLWSLSTHLLLFLTQSSVTLESSQTLLTLGKGESIESYDHEVDGRSSLLLHPVNQVVPVLQLARWGCAIVIGKQKIMCHYPF